MNDRENIREQKNMFMVYCIHSHFSSSGLFNYITAETYDIGLCYTKYSYVISTFLKFNTDTASTFWIPPFTSPPPPTLLGTCTISNCFHINDINWSLGIQVVVTWTKYKVPSFCKLYYRWDAVHETLLISDSVLDIAN